MMKKLKELFGKNKPAKRISIIEDKNGAPVSAEHLVAVLVILIEMSGRDQNIALAEADAIVALMVRHFEIAEADVPPLIQIALEERAKKGKIDDFVKTINSAYNEEQRKILLAMIWKIVTADGTIEKFEMKFAVQMRYRLQLSDQSEAEARELADSGFI